MSYYHEYNKLIQESDFSNYRYHEMEYVDLSYLRKALENSEDDKKQPETNPIRFTSLRMPPHPYVKTTL